MRVNNARILNLKAFKVTFADQGNVVGQRPRKRPLRYSRRLVLVGFAFCLSWLVACSKTETKVESQAAKIEPRVAQGQPEQALEAISALPRNAVDDRMQLRKWEALIGTGQLEKVAAELALVSSRGDEKLAAILLKLAAGFWERGQLAAATDQLRLLVDHFPKRLDFRFALSTALNDQGRRFETLPYLFEKVRLGVAEESDLILLADLDSMVEISAERLETLLKSDDSGARVASARTAIAYGKLLKARQLLEPAIGREPRLAEAWARWGAVLIDSTENSEFLAWADTSLNSARTHPLTCFLLARLALDSKQVEAAASHSSEALRLNPSHGPSWHLLGRALAMLGHEASAKKCSSRAKLLDEVVTESHAIYRSGLTGERALKIAILMDRLGRRTEAILWLKAHLVERDERSREAESLLGRLQMQVSPDSGWNASELLDALEVDFESLPRLQLEPLSAAASQSSSGIAAKISFVDEAELSGITFRFFNGEDQSTPGRRMFEYTGGGTGVLDYDRDGREDLYFCQGRHWPFDFNQVSRLDSLFRQSAPGRFTDVTSLAGVVEGGFSQGIAVGDINQDGWPDIYVGNLGANSLWLNSGDGTFRPITLPPTDNSHFWTMSCGIADLDGDSLPDLVDINYLDGPDVYSRVCEEDGHLRSCAPVAFPAAPDVLWRNLGDETFQDISRESHFEASDGDGLGLVIADFENAGRLSVFVANDGVANHFFSPTSSSSHASQPTSIQFAERALEAGLAFDRNGKAQACMGIAVDDVNRDGLVDLYVTNFFDESNTLYVQHPGLLFLDETHSFGLREPSIPMLGFGCQFIDAENDSFPDLLITNGHVDDLTYKRIPYQMRSQFHRNTGKGSFVELTSNTIGAFFNVPRLGRSMAKCDWNRDGLADVVISCLDTPAVLLTNKTKGAGNWVAITLVGTQSEREPIGSTVTVTADAAIRRQQLFAGDGYAASNSKELIFGIGNGHEHARVEIKWRSGETSVYESVAVNRRYVAVEGRARLWRVD